MGAKKKRYLRIRAAIVLPTLLTPYVTPELGNKKNAKVRK